MLPFSATLLENLVCRNLAGLRVAILRFVGNTGKFWSACQSQVR